MSDLFGVSFTESQFEKAQSRIGKLSIAVDIHLFCTN